MFIYLGIVAVSKSSRMTPWIYINKIYVYKVWVKRPKTYILYSVHLHYSALWSPDVVNLDTIKGYESNTSGNCKFYLTFMDLPFVSMGRSKASIVNTRQELAYKANVA